MEKFFTKIDRKSVEPIDLSDLTRMKNYQLALVNEMVYQTTAQEIVGWKDKTNAMLQEISRVERWLNGKFEEFVNDNKRKLAL